MTVPHHVADVQVFGHDQAEGVDQLSGLFVVKVQPLVSDLAVDGGNNQPGFLPVGAPFLLAGEGTLGFFQLAFGYYQIFRIGNV